LRKLIDKSKSVWVFCGNGIFRSWDKIGEPTRLQRKKLGFKGVFVGRIKDCAMAKGETI